MWCLHLSRNKREYVYVLNAPHKPFDQTFTFFLHQGAVLVASCCHRRREILATSFVSGSVSLCLSVPLCLCVSVSLCLCGACACACACVRLCVRECWARLWVVVMVVVVVVVVVVCGRLGCGRGWCPKVGVREVWVGERVWRSAWWVVRGA